MGDNFEKVMAEDPNPKKKHLLHRLVKKVLIHSRQTIEVWYGLPNSQRFADCNIWLPECNSMRTRPGQVKPEIYFRIIHVARDGVNNASLGAYRAQTVEVALGPNGAFKNDNIGALRRRVPAGRVMSAVTANRGNPKKPKEPKTPQVVELLRKAIEWRRQLDAGEIHTQADIARREGITRARVTQIMGMLNLAPGIRGDILSTPNTIPQSTVTERVLRPIAAITDHHDQVREFFKLLG